MIRTLLATVALSLLTAFQIVPAPRVSALADGAPYEGAVVSCVEPAFRAQAEVLVDALRGLGAVGAALTDVEDATCVVRFTRDESLAPEGYAIAPGAAGSTVSASTPAGAARAAATLLQTVRIDGGRARWPRTTVADEPDLPYRSLMVDMGRNPHSPATLRHVVDLMWFTKGNVLQLHLSDDQLFSWPSRAFPKLASARAGWTWEDFVELERYAVARGVTLVPELDVPGHSTILRREYPEVFGETPTNLATSPAAQAGVEALIDELLEVFRSTPFVHVGGDEAYGVPQDVQRDFINRLNAHVTARGRRTVVWEGPHLGAGENKVAEDVLHMNWRTIDFPAQQMLDAGYEVVNACWDPLYVVDHYPRTMFTAVEVRRFHDWDLQRFAHVNHEMPTFANPHRTRSADGILGFCMPWWEGREENLLPLCVPRFAAVASAAWNRSGEDDFDDFRSRYERVLPTLEAISGFTLPETPYAAPETQTDNLAYRAAVTPSSGASQPVFGPDRLTNGIPDRFDHFLGFPTQPEPLEILLELVEPALVARIVVHETAVGASHEIYDVLVSGDGETFEAVGHSEQGTRGERSYVEHVFPARRVSHIKIVTQGCHGLTFPSFSRLTEVVALGE